MLFIFAVFVPLSEHTAGDGLVGPYEQQPQAAFLSHHGPTDTEDGNKESSFFHNFLKLIPLQEAASERPVECAKKDVRQAAFTEPSLDLETPSLEPINIMTFNVRTSLAHDAGPRGWQHRKERVASIIRDNHPAVVGLQEPTGQQMNDLEPLLGEHYEWFRAKRSTAVVGYHAYEYNPIIFDVRQVKLEQDGRFWLSEFPHRADSRSWGTAVPRVVNWGKFRRINTHSSKTSNDSDAFYVFNVHLDHLSAEARLRGSDLILKQISKIVVLKGDANDTQQREEKSVVFLIGDFNCNRRSHPWKLLIGQAVFKNAKGLFFDAWDTAKCRVNPIRDTWHDYKGCNTTDVDGSEHIDGILYQLLSSGNRTEQEAREETSKHVEVQDATVILNGNEDGNFPSDHFPVIATFVFDTKTPVS